MARKRAVFFRALESFLKRGFSLLLLGLLGCLLTLSFSLWKMAVSSPIPQQVAEINRTSEAVSNPSPLLEQGREWYEEQRYSEAVTAFQEAAEQYAQLRDIVNQSLALSSLSLTHQKLGEWAAAQTAITASLDLLEPLSGETIAQAVSFNVQGHLQLNLAQAEGAFQSWQQAAATYQKLGDKMGERGSLMNQSQALEQMGYYRRSCHTLLQVVGAENMTCDQLDSTSNLSQVRASFEGENSLEIQAAALRSLGNVLRAIGQLEESEQILTQSLALAGQLDSNSQKSLSLFYLGNTESALATQKQGYGEVDAAKEHRNQAFNFYQKSIAIAPYSTLKLLGQVNQLSLLAESTDAATNSHEIRRLFDTIQSQIAEISLSKPRIESRIKVACSLMQCRQLVQGEKPENPLVPGPEIETLLQTAFTEAETLRDGHLQSAALGLLGQYYEYQELAQGQKNRNSATWEQAKTFTQNALALATESNAAELRYQWQWQMGRLQADIGELEGAIADYRAAVETLDLVRNDLLTVNADVQFSFRDNVEPMYRGFVDLLLQTADENPSHLQQAIQLIDALQLAELENFLQCNLTNPYSGVPDSSQQLERSLNDITRDSALIYPILLPNRIEVLFKLPNQPLSRHITSISRDEVRKNIKELRTQIVGPSSLQGFVEYSGNLYQWLIAPLESALEMNSEVKTLVFVLDGELRNIPVSVLYDTAENQYLIEKNYALALLPNLQIFDLEKTAAQRQVLATGVTDGLTVGEKNFAPLNVGNELESIQNIISTEILLNAQFTQNRLQRALTIQPFSIVHMATHGKFSSNPQETYILVYGDQSATGELIGPNELERLLRDRDPATSLELLVLSACETADGDNRATLGLAGLALRAGTSSTLATLWRVRDDSTIQLMERFYTELMQSGITKAEALHRAQKALLKDKKYQNPRSWAPYILVGNWR
ncbi:CHAT domain-containing protein [Laspinema sp. A4]|uniref:CHAT domain-containing protein n=1 Tax=Laspinema sp. D2d TaxID=2953686 RepID=UPI0021BB2708|nr:CHAT domain-containing protein [Laspinema sp. D2d]MCT7982227.1 CHAT domain-containing protein [Laspinema sp. D2d]